MKLRLEDCSRFFEDPMHVTNFSEIFIESKSGWFGFIGFWYTDCCTFQFTPKKKIYSRIYAKDFILYTLCISAQIKLLKQFKNDAFYLKIIVKENLDEFI